MAAIATSSLAPPGREQSGPVSLRPCLPVCRSRLRCDGPARAYFGEWIDDIREKTGGLLDRFKAPRVFLGTSDEPLPVKRNENNLEFAVKGRGDVRFVDNSVPPREDKEKGGVTKTIYYAKVGRSETAAKLDLELVPTETNGKSFVLVFFKAPL